MMSDLNDLNSKTVDEPSVTVGSEENQIELKSPTMFVKNMNRILKNPDLQIEAVDYNVESESPPKSSRHRRNKTSTEQASSLFDV